MINYYEILEVSEKASDEIIDKAYKVLAKKYHPDLQQNSDKKLAEEKMKSVNEAYEILSNHEKRAAYDKKKEQQRMKETFKNTEQASSNNMNNASNVNKVVYKYENANYSQEEQKRQQKLKADLEKEARRKYQEAYDNYLRSLGYKIKYRWTWEKVKTLLITIFVIACTGAILWIIPPSREYMIKLYEENFIIKMFVDIIGSILSTFVEVFKK